MRSNRASPRQRGQGMIEYVVIVALIAIGTVAVVTAFGDNIRSLFDASANAIVSRTSNPTQAKTLQNFADKRVP